MNRNWTSLMKTLALAMAVYACTEDTEHKQQLAGTDDLALSSVSVKNASSAKTSSAFHPGVGAPIAFTDAQRWIKAYRQKYPDAIRSRFFGKSAFDRIFSNPEAVGISINYAIDDSGVPVLLLVGVSGEGKVLAKSQASAKGSSNTSSFEDASLSCPTACEDEEE